MGLKTVGTEWPNGSPECQGSSIGIQEALVYYPLGVRDSCVWKKGLAWAAGELFCSKAHFYPLQFLSLGLRDESLKMEARGTMHNAVWRGPGSFLALPLPC